MQQAHPQGLDLRAYLEQGRVQAHELLDTMAKLVLEVKASHYWTVHGLETLSSLSSIGANIEKLLGSCQQYWHEGSEIFSREEALKLYKSAAGLYRAIPAVALKFNDQLDKRRKQRIMGQSYDESAEITPEEMQEALTAFTLRVGEVKSQFGALAGLVSTVPEGLAPTASAVAAAQQQQQQAAAPPPQA